MHVYTCLPNCHGHWTDRKNKSHSHFKLGCHLNKSSWHRYSVTCVEAGDEYRVKKRGVFLSYWRVSVPEGSIAIVLFFNVINPTQIKLAYNDVITVNNR